MVRRDGYKMYLHTTYPCLLLPRLDRTRRLLERFWGLGDIIVEREWGPALHVDVTNS